ncbi:secreted RxLR effector protein 78-like [Jatropha curcas]|uniref:secreted RxLR effector protein 78-like n=1 Tax=Jatropha curcas TaxID=180498 RepID=UPI0018940485|nr:secreted RxLR effector protein 78-like [Jatropha curcas]
MVTYKVIHYLKRKTQGKMGKIVLKIDTSKAYDRVEWEFLQGMMTRLGFSKNFIDLVMTCVTTVEYTILQDGKELSLVNPKRGLRQGCPLSPYLFIMCSKGLSSLLRDIESKGLIHGLSVYRGKANVVAYALSRKSLVALRAMNTRLSVASNGALVAELMND